MAPKTYKNIQAMREERGGEIKNEWPLGRGHHDDLDVLSDSASRHQDISVTLAPDSGVLYATNHVTGRVAVLAECRDNLPLDGRDMTLCVWRESDSAGNYYGDSLSTFQRAFQTVFSDKVRTPGMTVFYKERGGEFSRELTFNNIPNNLLYCDAPWDEPLRVGFVQDTRDIYAHAASTDKVEIIGELTKHGLYEEFPFIYRTTFHRWFSDDKPKQVSWFRAIAISGAMRKYIYGPQPDNDLTAEEIMHDEVLDESPDIILFPVPIRIDIPCSFFDWKEPDAMSALKYIVETGHWYLHARGRGHRRGHDARRPKSPRGRGHILRKKARGHRR